MRSAFAFVVLGITLFASAAFAEPYTAQDLGLRFEMPSGWSTEGEIGGGMMGDPSLFLLPSAEEERSRNAVGVWVIGQTAGKAGVPTDLSQVVDNFSSQMAWAKEYTLLSEENVTIGGRPAKQIIYRGVVNGIEEKIRHSITFVFHKDRLLKIDFSSTESHYDAQRQQAASFFDTLTFVP